MIHLSIRRAVRCASYLMPLLGILGLFLVAGMSFAAAVGDQVELKARNRAGVPLHQEPRGTHDFQRLPDGTKATVIELAQDGRWLKLTLADGRIGWVTSSYISDMIQVPSTNTSPTGQTPQRIEEGLVERVADGDTLTVDRERREIPGSALWSGGRGVPQEARGR
jgi:hypothetical protein